MPETPDKWPLPKYEAPDKDYVHAIGMISLNYNLFESTLSAVFAFHLIEQGVDTDFSHYLFGELNEQKRMDAIEEIFKKHEKDSEILDRITHLLAYFAWCKEARNLVLHAHEHPFDRTGKPGSLALIKRSKGDYTKFNFMYLSLPHLRAIADHMRAGFDFVVPLFSYLLDRAGELSAEDKKNFPPKLPDKPPIPNKIKLRDNPATPEDDGPPLGSKPNWADF